MALPDRTLCWVTGPPWDRNCEPVGDGDVEAPSATLDVLTDGRLVRLHVCARCGALVADAELHRRWHEGSNDG